MGVEVLEKNNGSSPMGIEKIMNIHQGDTRGDDLGSLNNLTVGEGKQG